MKSPMGLHGDQQKDLYLQIKMSAVLYQSLATVVGHFSVTGIDLIS